MIKSFNLSVFLVILSEKFFKITQKYWCFYKTPIFFHTRIKLPLYPVIIYLLAIYLQT